MSRQGLSVIPVLLDGSKRAAVKWKPYTVTAASKKQIRAWLQDPDRYGLAVVCGAVSGGLELLETEGAVTDSQLLDVEEVFRTAQLGELWDRIHQWVEASPGGGLDRRAHV